MSPGTKKKSGASGGNGSRNNASNTACATSPLLRSERGTVLTSSCSILPLAFLSLYVVAPIKRSTVRSVSLFSASDSGWAGQPGFKSKLPERFLIASSSTGAAAIYATTIVSVAPARRSNGPEDSKNRMSSVFCVTKHTCCAFGFPPGTLHGASPFDGSRFAER